MANLAVRMGSACCVFGIGIGLVVQAAVNARLGEKLGNPVYAACTAMIIGVAIICIVVGFFAPPLWDWRINSVAYEFKPIPRFLMFCGGCFGALYVTSTIYVSPIIGFSLFYTTMVAGQMLVSNIYDHIGFLGLPLNRFTWVKAAITLFAFAGVALLIAEQDFGESPGEKAATFGYSMIAFISGLAIPTQGCVNGQLSKFWQAPNARPRTVLLSFFVSFVILIVICIPLAIVQNNNGDAIFLMDETEWWMYLGTFGGLATVYGIIVFPAYIGISGYIICQVSGQLVTSLVIDNYGLIGFEVKPASAMRICGVLLVCSSAIGLQLAKQQQEAKQRRIDSEAQSHESSSESVALLATPKRNDGLRFHTLEEHAQEGNSSSKV